MKEKEKKDELKKIREMAGKINIEDIDRDVDLFYAVSDFWNIEKHLNGALNAVVEKLEKDPSNEHLNKLFKLLCSILDETRKHRTIHLERLQKLKEFSIWCFYKHVIGLSAQLGEVGAKDIHIALEKEKLLKEIKDEKKRKELEEEIKKDWENVKNDFKSSKFTFDIVFLLDKFAEKYLKTENK